MAACAIPCCPRHTKPGHLMCWPHWRRVPRVLNRAIFETVYDDDSTAYDANVAEAVRIILEKEAAEAANG